MTKKILIVLAVLFCATRAQAATLAVPGSYTFSAALAAAVCGDIISIDPSHTATGNFILPNKGDCSGNPIIIQSSTAGGNLPAAGVRITKGSTAGSADGTTDYRSFLPNFKASAGGYPVIRTAAGANGYILRWLEFEPNPLGYNAIIEIGNNSSSQTTRASQPKNFTIDQIILYGDTVYGQKVGIDLNGQNLIVRNSHIDTIHALGQDAVGVRSMNASGPITVTNNTIEASTENFLSGGSDPWMMAKSLVTAATTSSATLGTITDRNGASTGIGTLKVGQTISMLASGGTKRVHPTVLSCGTSTVEADCTSANITFTTTALTPDTGSASDARWGEIASAITFTRNHVLKRTSWKTGILAQATNVSATPQTGTGSLAAGTYYYKVVATNVDGYTGSNVYAPASAEVTCVLTATGQCNLSWNAVTGISEYRIYGRVSPQTGYLTTTGTSLTDSGGSLTTGTVPSTVKTVIKNLLEIKFGRNILISSNIFENNWGGQGDSFGQCLWIKSNNTDAGAEYAETGPVMIEKNVCRNVNGFLNLLATNETLGQELTKYLNNVTIRNNLVYDSDDGTKGPGVDAIRINGAVQNVTIEHNTLMHRSRGTFYFTVDADTVGFVTRNNMFRNENYGILGTNSCTHGTGCLTGSTVAPTTVLNNVFAGSPSGTYPTNNFYPSISVYDSTTTFVNPTGTAITDYALAGASAYNNAATDGTDVGADIAAVNTAVTGVLTGTVQGGAPAVVIATTTLPGATVGQSYNQTLTITGGTAPFTCSTFSGTLPPGLSWSAAGPNCVLSGSATGTSQTYNFTARVTDSATTPQTDDQALSIVVTASAAALNITTTTLAAVEVAQPISVQLISTGGTAPINWTVNTGSSLPSWLTLSPTGLLEGVPDAAGTFNFTVLATDSAGTPLTDTQALSQLVTLETMVCNRSRRYRIGGLTVEKSVYRRSSAPTNTAPDCAMKGDDWYNTATGQKFSATQSSPLVWSLDESSSGAGVVLDNAPLVGDLIIGVADGQWARIPIGDLVGLHADSVTEGVFDPARIPGGSSGAAIPQIITLRADGSSRICTDCTSEEIDSGARHRVQADLTNASEIRVVVKQNAAAVTASVRIEYSTNAGGAWNTGCSVALSTSTGLTLSGAWTTIPAGMKADVLIRPIYTGGNGTEDPSVDNVYLQVK
jgi:hypothetical protein